MVSFINGGGLLTTDDQYAKDPGYHTSSTIISVTPLEVMPDNEKLCLYK